MPIQFSAAFRELTIADDTPADNGAGPLLYVDTNYVDPARPNLRPIEIFLAHPDFEPFKQEFIARIEALREFAENNQRRSDDPQAPGLPTEDIQKIRADLERFQTNLFDHDLDFYSTHKDMAYRQLKDAFFIASKLILREDGKLPVDRRLIALHELSPKLVVCPGGQLTELTETTQELLSAHVGLAGQIWRRKNELARQTILDFVTQRHDYDPGSEVHYVNFHVNYLAEVGDYGLPRQEDPLATEGFTGIKADDLIACAYYVAPRLRPEQLALTLARRYLDSVKDRVRNVASVDEPIPTDKLADVNKGIQELEKAERGQTAFFSPHTFLLTTDQVTYRLVVEPTPMAVELLKQLRVAGQVEGDEPTLLFEKTLQANDESASVKLMRWGDLFWVEQDNVRDALTLAALAQFSPAEVSAAAGADAPATLESLVRQVIDNADGKTLLSFPPSWAPHAKYADLRPKLASIDPAELAEALSSLIAAGLDLAAKNLRNESPLLVAARLGAADEFGLLLDRPDVVLDARDIGGWTALGAALRYGHAAMAQAFIVKAYNSDRLSEQEKAALLRPPQNGELVSARRYAMAQGHGQAVAIDNELVRVAKEQGWPETMENFVSHIKSLDLQGRPARLLALANGHAGAIHADNKLLIKAREKEWLDNVALGALIAATANGVPSRVMALQNGHAEALQADNELLIKAREKEWLDNAALGALIAATADGVPSRVMALQNGHAEALRADNELIIDARGKVWIDDDAVREILAAKLPSGAPGRLIALHNGWADAIRADNELIVYVREHGWINDADVLRLITAINSEGVSGRDAALPANSADALRADNELIVYARENNWIDNAAVRKLIAWPSAEDGVVSRVVALEEGQGDAIRADNELIILAREKEWINDDVIQELLTAQSPEGLPGRLPAMKQGQGDALHADNELIIHARAKGWINDTHIRQLIDPEDDGKPARFMVLEDGWGEALSADNEFIIHARENNWINDVLLRKLIDAKGVDEVPGRWVALENGWDGALRVDNELIIQAREKGWIDNAAVHELIAARRPDGVSGRSDALVKGRADVLCAENELILQACRAGWLDDAAVLELIGGRTAHGLSAHASALASGHANALQADNDLLIQLGEAGLLSEASFRRLLVGAIQECALARAIASQRGFDAAIQAHEALVDAARARGWLAEARAPEQSDQAGPSQGGKRAGAMGVANVSDYPVLLFFSHTFRLDPGQTTFEWTIQDVGGQPTTQLTLRDADGQIVVRNGQALQFAEEALRAMGFDPDDCGRREAPRPTKRPKIAGAPAADVTIASDVAHAAMALDGDDSSAFNQFLGELADAVSDEMRGLIAPALEQVQAAMIAHPEARAACFALAAERRDGGAALFTTLRRMVEACVAHRLEQPGELDAAEHIEWGVTKFRLDALRRLDERARAAGFSPSADWATLTPRIVRVLETGRSKQADALLIHLEGANAAGRPAGGDAGPTLLQALLADTQWRRFLERAHGEELAACQGRPAEVEAELRRRLTERRLNERSIEKAQAPSGSSSTPGPSLGKRRR
jgi:ankyrin repeat protein